MENKRINVQIIGHYLQGLQEPLKQHGIFTECLIDTCSTLTMAGQTDKSYFKYCEDKKMTMPVLLDIKKNLSQMLSHDPQNFCQNYNSQPICSEVRNKNTSEYLILMNSCLYSLFEKNGIVYTDSFPKNDFISTILSDSSYTRRVFPFSGDFNWKYYYNKFIDVITDEYDRNHIILVKTNYSQWYMEGKNICNFSWNTSQFQGFLREMDEYFIEKTNCKVIDEHLNHIPPKNIQVGSACIQMSNDTTERIAEEIARAIKENAFSKKSYSSNSNNEFIHTIECLLSADVLSKNNDNLYYIKENGFSLKEMKKQILYKENDFYRDIKA